MKHSKTRTSKMRIQYRAYFELADELPDTRLLRHAIVVPFYNHKVLMLKPNDRKLQFPRCRVEEGEYLHKTLRRKLYKDTGAFLEYSFLVGQFSVYDCVNGSFYVPVYIGKISHLEKKVSEKIGLVDVSKAVKQFAPYWEKPNLDFFARALTKYASHMKQSKNWKHRTEKNKNK